MLIAIFTTRWWLSVSNFTYAKSSRFCATDQKLSIARLMLKEEICKVIRLVRLGIIHSSVLLLLSCWECWRNSLVRWQIWCSTVFLCWRFCRYQLLDKNISSWPKIHSQSQNLISDKKLRQFHQKPPTLSKLHVRSTDDYVFFLCKSLFLLSHSRFRGCPALDACMKIKA